MLQTKLLAYFTCFITGFAILVLELNAFRLLAPYFGSSIYVSGIIINVILLALAIGYYLGGKSADKYKSPKKIGNPPYHHIFESKQNQQKKRTAILIPTTLERVYFLSASYPA